MRIRTLSPAENPAELDALLPAFRAASVEAMPGFPAPGAARLLMWATPGYHQRTTVFGAFADEGDEGDAGDESGGGGAVALGFGIQDVETSKNRDLASTQLWVPGAARGEGVHAALFEEAVRVAANAGRQRLAMAFSEIEAAAVVSDEFVEGHGGKLTDCAIRSALDLRAVDRALLEQWAAPSLKNSSYTFVTWDQCPEEYAQSFCAALDAMADQPMGEFDYDFGTVEVERLRFVEARGVRFGVRRYNVAALDPRGEIAGFTSMIAYPDEPETIEIANTGVTRQHRGHGLGLRLKAAAHLWVLRSQPDARWICTFNNDANKWMLDVNRALGYQAAERWPGYEFPVPVPGARALT
ncbi:GNAT family N-acetyltransferase [Actinospica robiniae]|uniref:GNAT family N-acetyltransferase n=1 Tax=Actinospica robiniae TaxID=304901 RepID=UPI00040A866B|nr:GNAT family N-acetyltransferase [Actinospica robiniae]